MRLRVKGCVKGYASGLCPPVLGDGWRGVRTVVHYRRGDRGPRTGAASFRPRHGRVTFGARLQGRVGAYSGSSTPGYSPFALAKHIPIPPFFARRVGYTTSRVLSHPQDTRFESSLL